MVIFFLILKLFFFKILLILGDLVCLACIQAAKRLKISKVNDTRDKDTLDQPQSLHISSNRDESHEESIDCLLPSSSTQQNSVLISAFLSRLPIWGGESIQQPLNSRSKQKKLTFLNTCSIDYFLLCLWLSKQLCNDWISINDYDNKVLVNKINNVVQFISELDWTNAKMTWIIDICRIQVFKNQYDCYASEYESFIRHLNFLQKYQLYCSNEKCESSNECEKMGDQLNFRKYKDSVNLIFFPQCSSCKSKLSCLKFFKKPIFLFVQTLYPLNPSLNDYISFNEIPKTLFLDNNEYKLICTTLHFSSSSLNSDHFCAIFNLNNKQFFIDNLITPAYEETIPDEQKITTCFYCLN